MTWAEVIRTLNKAGFVERRTGKGSHLHFEHPDGRRVVVTVHTKKGAGELGNKILREAGIR